MPITRRDWWLAIGGILVALLANALLPRYEWRDPGGDSAQYIRIDRWKGTAQVGQFVNLEGFPAGMWVAGDEIRAAVAAGAKQR